MRIDIQWGGWDCICAVGTRFHFYFHGCNMIILAVGCTVKAVTLPRSDWGARHNAQQCPMKTTLKMTSADH